MSTYTPISSQTLSAAAASVTFSGIPQTYTDLVVIVEAYNGVADGYFARFRINGDSASNYSITSLEGNGTTASTLRLSNQTFMLMGYQNVPQSTTSTIRTTHILHFMNYSNTTTNKTVLMRSNRASSGVNAEVGLYRSTSAITSIEFLGDTSVSQSYGSGSTFTLYGIGAGSPKAFGGDEVTTDGTYWYHTFRSSGIFAPMINLTNVDYLVVAGGGGAGAGNGSSGGGGGGGVRCTVGATGGGGSLESKLSLTSGTNYTVTIGAGGAAGGTTSGNDGSNSVFSTITSTGGGGSGGGNPNQNGRSGGSGGGGGEQSSILGTGGAGTTNQGFAGAAGQSATYPSATYGSGGGGGSSAAATTHVGGAGIATSISGSSQNYGGGGGGGSYSATNTGGAGGGGKGRTETTQGFGTGTAGTVNTGGGAGGSIVGSGAAGGSGIVIVRYAV